MIHTQRLIIPIGPDEWLLQNHRYDKHVVRNIRRNLRVKAGWMAKAQLEPVTEPVAAYFRAYCRSKPLPDADAIAPMAKSVLDGIVDAKIMPDDKGQHVPLVGYGRPEIDRTLKPKMRALMVVLTDQFQAI